MLRRQLASHNPDIHNLGTGRGTGQVSAHATAKEATQLARSAWWNGGAASPPGTVARASLRNLSAQLCRSGCPAFRARRSHFEASTPLRSSQSARDSSAMKAGIRSTILARSGPTSSRKLLTT